MKMGQLRKTAQADPHIRIVMAARAGRGVRLTAEQAYDLGVLDDAVSLAAQNKAEDLGFRIDGSGRLKKLTQQTPTHKHEDSSHE